MQNTFHETFCKTGIDPEGLNRVTPKTDETTTIAKTSPQQQMRVSFINRNNTDHRCF